MREKRKAFTAEGKREEGRGKWEEGTGKGKTA